MHQSPREPGTGDTGARVSSFGDYNASPIAATGRRHKLTATTALLARASKKNITRIERALEAAKPPAIIADPGMRFWVSAYKPPRDGGRASVDYRGYAGRHEAEARERELKARIPEPAVCLTDGRPPSANPQPWKGRK